MTPSNGTFTKDSATSQLSMTNLYPTSKLWAKKHQSFRRWSIDPTAIDNKVWLKESMNCKSTWERSLLWWLSDYLCHWLLSCKFMSRLSSALTCQNSCSCLLSWTWIIATLKCRETRFWSTLTAFQKFTIYSGLATIHSSSQLSKIAFEKPRWV